MLVYISMIEALGKTFFKCLAQFREVMNFPSLPKNIVPILEKALDSHMIQDMVNNLQC